MKDSLFKKLLIAFLAVGIISSLALVIYTLFAYHDASIITFIAEEFWW